jgi:uncharacterized protein (DUF433 family)
MGLGVYSVPDASRILGFPVDTIRRWVKTYWEDKFSNSPKQYTWGEGKDRGFNFYTLVELIAIHALREKNVSFQKIIEARRFLQKELNTEYPFASSKVMSDGEQFYYTISKTELMDVNLSKQLSIKKIVEPYCEKLDFSSIDLLARRFWPLGKSKSVVVDPEHKFGEPTIEGTNISVDIIASMVEGGDNVEMIANIYRLTPQQVKDAVKYCEEKHVAA